MFVRSFPVGLLQCNCTILGCEQSREALVIDPGDDVEQILQVLETEGFTCMGILHTHAHLDHLGATAPLARATGAPILLHPNDLPLYEHVPDQAALFGFRAPLMDAVDRFMKDGDSLAWGRCQGELLHTPGHTPGSLCLRVAWDQDREDAGHEPDRLFAGDTLFAGSIGRTDLWGGDHEQILDSIRRRLYTLPDETIVIPGHGPATTIGEERRTNPFVRG